MGNSFFSKRERKSEEKQLPPPFAKGFSPTKREGYRGIYSLNITEGKIWA
jgi:hypothetical protein